MIAKAKFEKALDAAVAVRLGAAFDVLVTSIHNQATDPTREIAVNAFTATVRSIAKAYELAAAVGAELSAPKK